MSSEDREQAKKSLKELHRKRQFIRSPRGLTQEYHTNTASFGTLRKRQSSEKPNRGTGGKRVFQADPMEVIFTNYLPGETYEVSLLVYLLLHVHENAMAYCSSNRKNFFHYSVKFLALKLFLDVLYMYSI